MVAGAGCVEVLGGGRVAWALVDIVLLVVMLGEAREKVRGMGTMTKARRGRDADDS